MEPWDLSAAISQFDSATLTPEQLFRIVVPLVERLNSGNEPKIAWCLAIAILAELNEIEMTVQLLSAAAEKFGHAAPLCCQIYNWLFHSHKYQAIINIHRGVSANSSPYFISCYYMACISFTNNMYKDAFEYLKEFRKTPASLHDIILLDHDLNIIFRQGNLVQPPDYIDGLLAEPPVSPVSSLTFARAAIDPQPSGRPIFMCSGDQKYINAMLAQFLDLFPAGEADIIIVAVNIDAADLSVIDRLIAAHPDFRCDVVDIQSDIHSATFYSCARFYALQTILPRYCRPVVALDIDCALTVAGRGLLEQPFPDVDFACFRSSRDEPASYFQAGVMLWAATAQAREFLDLICLFCAKRAGENSRVTWMLDQAALFSMLYFVRRRNRPLRFVTLNRLIGKTLAEITVDTWDGPVSKGNLRGVLVRGTQAGLVLSEE